MEKHLATATASALLIFCLQSASVRAHGSNVGFLPNGMVNTCANCHIDPNGDGPRTSFGLDFVTARNSGLVVWEFLYDLDSDGDGQTNGQELGDPCGDWVMGWPPPRDVDISLPGDDTDLSADPDTPACDLPDAGPGEDAGVATDAGSSGGERPVGCGCQHQGDGGLPILFFLVVSTWLTIRPRPLGRAHR